MYFRECPNCGELLRFPDGDDWSWTNTRWTDGKNAGWSLRGFQDQLFRGYSCGKLFWLSETEHTNDKALFRVRESSELGHDLPPFAENVESEPFHLRHALTEGLCSDPERELYARMAVWWSANDHFRPLLEENDGGESCKILTATVTRSTAFVENQNLLLHLLNPIDPRELILKAEIYRELGRFDECISLLDGKEELFGLHYQIEYAQDSLRQRTAREDMGELGEDPIFDWSPKAEDLLQAAKRVLKCAIERDVLIRPL